jgi:hypothetical protein
MSSGRPFSTTSSVSRHIGEPPPSLPCSTRSRWCTRVVATSPATPHRPVHRRRPCHCGCPERGDRSRAMRSAPLSVGWHWPNWSWALGQIWPTTLEMPFHYHLSNYNSRNSCKFSKFVKFYTKVRKMQNKFPWNPF